MQARAEKAVFQSMLHQQQMPLAAHTVVWYCMARCACWALPERAERHGLGLGPGLMCEGRCRQVYRHRHVEDRPDKVIDTEMYKDICKKCPIYVDAQSKE